MILVAVDQIVAAALDRPRSPAEGVAEQQAVIGLPLHRAGPPSLGVALDESLAALEPGPIVLLPRRGRPGQAGGGQNHDEDAHERIMRSLGTTVLIFRNTILPAVRAAELDLKRQKGTQVLIR